MALKIYMSMKSYDIRRIYCQLTVAIRFNGLLDTTTAWTVDISLPICIPITVYRILDKVSCLAITKIPAQHLFATNNGMNLLLNRRLVISRGGACRNLNPNSPCDECF